MMKPYESYKETLIPWLGEVPSHWETERNSSLFFEVVDTNHPELDLLSITAQNGVIKQSSTGRKIRMSNDNSTYKKIQVGDIGYNLMNAFIGSIGVSKYEGIISPAYAVCRFRNQAKYNPMYYHILFRTKQYMQEFDNHSYGIMVERNRLYFERFKTILALAPPRDEQDQIVRYLDWKISKINQLVQAKKRQIELLKEQKQAVINKAVTKGLDDTVPMKDSGVEWLGEVPEHWEVKKLKRVCKVNASISKSASNYSDMQELVFLPMENITVDGKIDCSQKRFHKDVKSGYSSFARSDIVIAKITPCFENGKGAYLSELETEIGYGTTELITIRANDNILPQYLYWVTMTQYFRLNGGEQMTGSAGQKRVPTEFVSNFIQGIPPLEMQQTIVAYITDITGKIDTVVSETEQEIKLISEYKQSLISSVVTGQIDVRNVVVPEFEVVGEVTSDSEYVEMEMT